MSRLGAVGRLEMLSCGLDESRLCRFLEWLFRQSRNLGRKPLRGHRTHPDPHIDGIASTAGIVFGHQPRFHNHSNRLPLRQLARLIGLDSVSAPFIDIGSDCYFCLRDANFLQHIQASRESARHLLVSR